MKDYTTINIDRKTKNKLDAFKKHPRATYAEVIQDLVKNAKV